MTDYLALVHSLGALYRDVVTAPAEWGEARIVSWAVDLFAVPPDPNAARLVRRAMRVSHKLAVFWRDPPVDVPADAGDWRTRVDLAAGARAWRPVLELARLGLDESPSRELFEEVGRLFRLVHHQHWMDGASYEEWLRENDG